MATKLQQKTALAVAEWCAKHGYDLVEKPRHVHPRAYVVGQAAERCLVVSRPWLDSEPQCQTRDRKFPLDVIHTFDPALKAGDWCATAYVVRSGASETVAIPAVS